jgi:hypothetical protein
VRRRRISAAQSRSHTSPANHNPFASKVSLKLEPERGKLPFIEEVGRRIILGASLDLDLGDFGVVHLDLIIDGMAGASWLLVALTCSLLAVLRVCGQRPQSERDRRRQNDLVSGIHAQG